MTRLIQGFGINDVIGSYKEKYYTLWYDMIQRVKSEKFLKRNPTYRDCSICEEWKYLSNFKEWFEQANYIDGYVLDKDLYIPDNKLYSPKTCLFIPHNINCIINRQNGKGYSKTSFNTFQVKISIKGKRLNLGTYKTKKEAYKVYIEYKAKVYMTIADNEWIDDNPKIHLGLYRNAKYLLGKNWDDFVINNPLFYYPVNNQLIW